MEELKTIPNKPWGYIRYSGSKFVQCVLDKQTPKTILVTTKAGEKKFRLKDDGSWIESRPYVKWDTGEDGELFFAPGHVDKIYELLVDSVNKHNQKITKANSIEELNKKLLLLTDEQFSHVSEYVQRITNDSK
jgi:hypothetical protein